MKKVPTLEDLANDWAKDAIINELEIPFESIKVDRLHSHYAYALAQNNLMSKKYLIDYNTLKAVKWEYFSGKASREDLAKYGWEQWQDANKTREHIERLIDKDADLNKILLTKALHDEAATMCTSIIRELSNRTWRLKTHTDYLRFMKGEG